MNINELSVYGDRTQKGNGAAVGSTALLESGRKEQISRQSISEVKDRITFGAKDSILSLGVMNGYDLTEQEKGSIDVSKAQKKANEDLAVLNGTDCESLEEDGDSLIQNTKEYVENAVRKNKERKSYNEKNQEKSLELRAQMREAKERREALGFSELKSETELKMALEEAGIAVTPENLDKVSGALSMSEKALEITDQTKEYIIRNELEPTVENLYQGKYMVYAKKAPETQEFEAYKGQLGNILKENGLDTEEGWENARWLFEHELPVNEGTMAKLSDLNRIAEEMTPARALTQILFTMAEGLEPTEAWLDDKTFLASERALENLEEITDEDIVLVAESGEKEVDLETFQKIRENSGSENAKDSRENRNSERTKIPVLTEEAKKAEWLSEIEKTEITLKRQLEEIRQKMTMQAAVSMERKGIHVETEPLEKVISELRRMEQAFTADQLHEQTDSISEAEFELWQETLEKTNDISNSFAGVLGSSVRQHALLTVNELHAAVSSENLSRREWAGVYETVQTQVRADLGDSIKKAFEGIPDILRGMGLEDTEANERAVRILGYNRQEITEENIGEVKTFDVKVNELISNMKPVTVLELIRKGENPLNTPIDELNEKLKHINEEKNVTDEEKYSRYLWKLEKDGQISDEERSGYIGIYRLLHQIEKSDGAVIGSLLGSGRELTLGNLLKEVRSRKNAGMDLAVDDASGAREAVHTKESISEQIDKGFSGNMEENGGQQDSSPKDVPLEERLVSYYEKLVADSLEEISPSKIQEIADGEIQRLLGYSVERFAEELKRAHGNEGVKKEYYEAMAEEIRNGLKDTEAAEELLMKLSIPETIGNLMAAKAILNGNENVYKEIYDRRKVLERKEEERLEEVIDEIPEVLDSSEELEKSCEQAEKIMQEVLTKSKDLADITFEDLQKLGRLGRGIRLQAAFRESKSYDIPIRTGDSITSLNLTIVHGADETGKVQIYMEDEAFGRLSLDFKLLKDSSVKGLVLCSERQGFEDLRGARPELEKEVEDAGFSVKNISYGMDFKSRNELADGSEQKLDADTRELYRLAKVLVRQIVKILK